MNSMFMKRLKSLLFAVAIIVAYTLWPLDLMPGLPVDDIIVAIVTGALEAIKQTRMIPSEPV